MQSRSKSYDVVVIGGGLIGCSIAWQLALRGLRVIVIERDTPAKAASWAAAGMLSPVRESTGADPLGEAANASFDLYPHFIEALQDATGIDPQYTRSGKLHVAFTAEEFDHMSAVFSRIGDDARMLSADEVRGLEPALTDNAAGGALVARDYHVENRLLGRAVWLAAARSGVTFANGASTVAITRHGDEVSGVTLATGESIGTRHVIVAAGAWSNRISGLPRALPVVPVRGQMCALELVPPPLTRMVQTRDVYVIPRASGRVLVGATVEHVGFHNECTAAGIRAMLNGAIEAVPALEGATLAEVWSGLRPGTIDDLPILGPDPELAGVIYATGHYRNGILLAPVTANVITALVIGTAPMIDLTPFQVDRFRGRTADA